MYRCIYLYIYYIYREREIFFVYIYIYIYIYIYVFSQSDLLGTPLNLLLFSQKCQGVPFSPIRQKVLTFAAAPFSADPTCPQPRRARRPAARSLFEGPFPATEKAGLWPAVPWTMMDTIDCQALDYDGLARSAVFGLRLD